MAYYVVLNYPMDPVVTDLAYRPVPNSRVRELRFTYVPTAVTDPAGKVLFHFSRGSADITVSGVDHDDVTLISALLPPTP